MSHVQGNSHTAPGRAGPLQDMGRRQMVRRRRAVDKRHEPRLVARFGRLRRSTRLRRPGPDLDQHCQRHPLRRDARPQGDHFRRGDRAPVLGGHRALSQGGRAHVRPLFWADDGFLYPDPESTRFALTIFEAALPQPKGFSACLSPFRRPSPRNRAHRSEGGLSLPQRRAHAVRRHQRGFDSAVIMDLNGNVAEFASSFRSSPRMAEDVAINNFTGITRQRVIQLLRQAGVDARAHGGGARGAGGRRPRSAVIEHTCTRYRTATSRPSAPRRELGFGYANRDAPPRPAARQDDGCCCCSRPPRPAAADKGYAELRIAGYP